ncbi:hypothetical protein [Tsukamurella sp. NPDC003166]|uniref:hypothetical protein n=1 Tax=Tsukamurella sp. NPDC003166 TaxID=3154444 RepID=UPI0033AD2732
MIFETITEFATKLSQTAGTTEGGMSNLLPTERAETTHVPPHDPALPYEVGVQDPKVVRETIPALRNVFDYVGGVTGGIAGAVASQSSALKDPTSTTDAAGAIFKQGAETTSKVPEKVQKPSVDQSPAPTVPTAPKPNA